MGASTLIVARPGPLRDGLQALVGSMPQVGAVEVAGDVEAALRPDSDLSPALILFDADLSTERVWRAVRRARRRWPRARTIVLVGDVVEQREAEAAGADIVLLKGLPAGRLVAAIVKLLPRASL